MNCLHCTDLIKDYDTFLIVLNVKFLGVQPHVKHLERVLPPLLLNKWEHSPPTTTLELRNCVKIIKILRNNSKYFDCLSMVV